MINVECCVTTTLECDEIIVVSVVLFFPRKNKSKKLYLFSYKKGKRFHIVIIILKIIYLIKFKIIVIKMREFVCNICEKTYEHNQSLNRHLRLQHSIECVKCNQNFSTYPELLKHMKSMDHNEKKEEKTVYCENCNLAIPKNQWKNHISTNTHIDKCVKWLDKDVSCFGSSFQNRIESYKIKNSEINNLIPENFFKSIQEKVINIIQKALQKHESIKYNCTLHCNYILMKEKAEDEISLFTHHTKMLVLSPSSTLEEILNHYIENCNEIIKKMSEFQERDSGWTLIEIKHLEININKYTCLRGSQYINLPPKIRNKKACINVQNNDVYCFKWAIISALNPLPKEKKPHKCSNYKVTDIKAHIITLENNIILNFENMEFPLTINKIRVFELQNPDIKAEKSTHINLLLIEEDDKFHYIWIKNISRLLRSSITKNKNRIHFCNTCLTHVSSSSRLEKHKRECKKMVTTMPSDKDKILKFKNFKHKLDIPFSILGTL
ncbi:uncharacterized protein LOC131996156 [Stomoxys calcitrans]|uniref:uncharacterized protein LOC131994752 n=1 Tax=Stomoxys calcitrans TaxID=35570 RepID=UPI0027E2717D|nr:uncharacterized protein LOC131994752 [Stomoxys calcitrans]XP_059217606.1 uncharacterized protein LOC131994753 [Stomoxys calcitrans]XP_059217742.1 uncharacterized protein LOC131994837 [Stomoxys calcitrans]XP_059221592.1 uncharacterized protein LOC131996156 [Stomoxys calcitrans]